MSKRRFIVACAFLFVVGLALGAYAAYSKDTRLSTLIVAGGDIEDVVENASGSTPTFSDTIINGTFTFSGSTFDLDPTGHYTLALDDTKLMTIDLDDNQAAAFTLQDVPGDDYLKIDTTTGSEKLTVGNATNDPDLTLQGGGDLACTMAAIDLDPTGHFTLDMDAAKQVTLTLTDNNAAAMTIQEGSNGYMVVNTGDDSEIVTFGNTTTNPNYAFTGSGDLSGPTGLINFGTAASGVEIANGTDLPDTCTVGVLFLDTNDDQCDDANDAGDGVLCLCKATNTFAAVIDI
jgi:hypothetical protein